MIQKSVPEEDHLNLFSTWNHVEGDATVSLAKALWHAPQIRREVLERLLDGVDLDPGIGPDDIDLREPPKTEVDVSRDFENPTYLLGLQQRGPDKTDIHLGGESQQGNSDETDQDSDGDSDRPGQIDLVLELESGATAFDLGVEVKTGSDSLDEDQIRRYDSQLGADDFAQTEWRAVRSAVGQVVSEFDGDGGDTLGPSVSEHYHEYLTVEVVDSFDRVVAEQRWENSSEGTNGRDQIQLKYAIEINEDDEEENEELYVVFDSKTESDEDTNNRYTERLPWGEFDGLFENFEDRHSAVLEEAFVGDESGVGGVDAIKRNVSGFEVLAEIDAVETDNSNYLRLFYDPNKEMLRLREAQPSNGSSPSTKGSPAGGGEQYIWELNDSGEDNDELTRLLIGNDGFDYELRKALFWERDRDAVVDAIQNSEK